jgi:hypothetical protein
MPTIYEQNAGSLIAQPDRSVTTFDSGLLRVDQEFVCATANADTNRASLAVGNEFPGDTSPAIDGLFIFPAAQESRTGDGLTRFRVSGYGRSTDGLVSQRRGTTSTVIKSAYYINNQGQATIAVTIPFAIVSTNSLTGKIAILSENGLTYDQLNLDPLFIEPLNVVAINRAYTISEDSRSSSIQNAVSWDGQIYINIITTVQIQARVTEFARIVAFYTYSTPVIGIDFSTSYGKLTELGINVSVPIGNPTVFF